MPLIEKSALVHAGLVASFVDLVHTEGDRPFGPEPVLPAIWIVTDSRFWAPALGFVMVKSMVSMTALVLPTLGFGTRSPVVSAVDATTQ
ncbi:unannotated protein [freshwater metagenome]|uniref:Unannotated protein n=1 Tax=freshwater metagenome TaxID=449393 RepID=A0A6J7FQV5_9ZZZZ